MNKSFSQWLQSRLPRLVAVLFVLQPLLDVVSYWLDYFEYGNTLTLTLRLIILAAMVTGGYVLCKKKTVYFLCAGGLLLLTAAHCFACWQAGYDQVLYDLTNLVRIYQFPLAVLCFHTWLDADPRVYEAIRRGFFLNMCIIAAIALLSLVTGTNPYTYTNKSIGLLGWFYLPSAQSAILSCIVPVAVAWGLDRWKDCWVRQSAVTLGGLALLFFLGTRLSYLALFATGVGLALTLLLTDRRRKKTLAALLACTAIFLLAFPISPMYRNQTLVGENAVKKQAYIDSLIREDEKAALDQGLSGDALRLARLESAYDYYLGGLVDRFGLERVAQRYDYSESASDLAHVRKMRVSYCALLQQELPLSAKLFGMELGDLTYEGFAYDVENDLHGIYYLCGALGLGLMLLFLIWFVLLILRALVRNFRGQFTLPAAGWGIAFLTCLTHIYATAGVLRRPNVSIYLSAVLACIAYLTRNKAKSSSIRKGI